MHQSVPQIIPAPNIWSFYGAGEIRRAALRWTHQTFVLVLLSPGTTAVTVREAGAESVEFVVRGVCDDGEEATVSYTLFLAECDLLEEEKRVIYDYVRTAMHMGRDPLRARTLAVGKALGIPFRA